MMKLYLERIIINGIDSIQAETMTYQDKNGTVTPGPVGSSGRCNARVRSSENLRFVNGTAIRGDIDP